VFDQAWDDWSFPLHSGDVAGTASRLVWIVLALSPLALGATGIVMNRIRHRKRKRHVRTGDVDGAGDAVDIESGVEVTVAGGDLVAGATS
jgi:uncharacterized iron-regulated membrane protein